MPNYTYTITAVVHGGDYDEAWDEWIGLLTDPTFVEDVTDVEIERDPVGATCPNCNSAQVGFRQLTRRCFNCDHRWEQGR